MISSPSFFRYPKGKQAPVANEALSYLGGNDRMAALLPTIKRIAAIQDACAAILPEMFGPCAVLHFHADQLLLAVPNAALAARLKQRLPRLQEELQRQGWQVNGIRLKIQMTPGMPKPAPFTPPKLPQHAVSALAELGQTLENTPRNAALKEAIDKLVRRHRGQKRA